MVRFGVRHGLALAVRGGGHSIPGLSVCDGGLVIDLTEMKAVRVDPERALVDVGPGVLWRELDAATQQHGFAVPGGEISHTGVAGLTLGGGVGWLSRAYGLACDNLVGAELVTADGSILQVDEHERPELMWGLRGGGGNFGVVTRFRFRLNPVPVPIYAGMVMHPLDRGRDALRAFLDLAAVAPDALGLNAALVVGPAGAVRAERTARQTCGRPRRRLHRLANRRRRTGSTAARVRPARSRHLRPHALHSPAINGRSGRPLRPAQLRTFRMAAPPR